MNQNPLIDEGRRQSGLDQRLHILRALCLQYLLVGLIHVLHLAVMDMLREVGLTGRSPHLPIIRG
jgi:hypothetical protein